MKRLGFWSVYLSVNPQKKTELEPKASKPLNSNPFILCEWFLGLSTDLPII